MSSKPPSPQEMEHRKKREKEEEKVLKKGKEKRKKATRVSSDKRGSQYFERRKHFNFKNYFFMIPFSPPPSYHFENIFQIIGKIFLTLFGPSFSMAIYMT
jgi:hypothetical protein